MRRNLLFVVVLAFILSACNLPAPSSAPSPTVDVLGTQVAMRLTATAAVAPSGVAPTAIPQASPTRLPTQQATVIPSATLPASATPTKEASPSPTTGSTQSASPTASLTPTATGLPGDPASDLGQPDWKDTFQKASTWGLQSPYDDGHTRVSLTPGKLVMMSYDSNGWRGWRMMNTKLKDFYLESTIQTQTCSGSDTYGMIFRSSGNANGYWLSVTCDGHYSLDAGDINNTSPVVESTASPLLNAGSNQTNRIGVMAKGNKVSIYFNGKLAHDVYNDSLTSAGIFGYFIAAHKTAGFAYQVTQVAYWELQ